MIVECQLNETVLDQQQEPQLPKVPARVIPAAARKHLGRAQRPLLEEHPQADDSLLLMIVECQYSLLLLISTTTARARRRIATTGTSRRSIGNTSNSVVTAAD
ncbi:hypothetical protein ACQ4LE_007711 [Meloidogyne hapla]|uniref:Uncharacterized protein n=1 Tax=Meloidogyne hapla TaxID=6305 RepID=A0A1I8BL89_MELHA